MQANQPPAFLSGRVAQLGTSRGKTMAAWDGIPTGQPFLLIRCDIRKSTVHAWFPNGAPPLEDLLGKRLRLRGSWQRPPEDKSPESVYESRQEPIAPVSIIELPSDEGLQSLLTPTVPSSPTEPSDSPPPAVSTIMAPVPRSRHFQADHVEILPES
jgi:hypothetical protein